MTLRLCGTREQPAEVQEQQSEVDPAVALPATGEPLTSVTAMGLVYPFAPQRAPHQRDGRVHEEGSAENQLHPDGDRICARCSSGKNGQYIAEITAANTAQEDLRRRPVPQ